MTPCSFICCSRYYDPALVCFISPDDISYLGANGDLNSYNLYAYCSNNPVMYTDPTGHSMVLAVLGIGLLIGLIGTAIADYADDGEVFNGSIDALSYAQNASVVALGGLLVYAALPYIGAFLSSSFTFTVPTLASAGTVAFTVTGAQVAGGTVVVGLGILLFASDHRPGNNRVQNKQLRDAVRQSGHDPNEPRIKDKINRIETYIRRKKLDLGWNELREFIKGWLR